MPLPTERFDAGGGQYRRWIWTATINTGEPENQIRFAESQQMIEEEVLEYIGDFINGSEDPNEPDQKLIRLKALHEQGEAYLAVDLMKESFFTYIDIEQRTMRCDPPTVEEHLDGEDAPDRSG